MANSINGLSTGNTTSPAGLKNIPETSNLSFHQSGSKYLISTIKTEKKSETGLGKINTPEIDTPVMDPDTAIIIVMDLQDRQNKSDVKNAYASLKSRNEFKNKFHEHKIKLMTDNLKKLEEEQEKKRAQGIGSDIGLGMGTAAAIFGLIGAIIFAVATGGAGIPAVVAASIGLGMATLDVGTRIAASTKAEYKDADGKSHALDLTLGGMVKRITEQLVHDHPDFPLGSTKENREQKIAELITGMTIFLNLAVAATMIALSVTSLRTIAKTSTDIGNLAADATKQAAKSAATAISQEAKFASSLAQVAQMTAELTQAASMVTSGAYGVQLAFISYDIKEVDNKKLEIDNFTKLLADEISTNQDFLTHLVENISEIYECMASVLSNYYQSQSRIKLSI